MISASYFQPLERKLANGKTVRTFSRMEQNGSHSVVTTVVNEKGETEIERLKNIGKAYTYPNQYYPTEKTVTTVTKHERRTQGEGENKCVSDCFRLTDYLRDGFGKLKRIMRLSLNPKDEKSLKTQYLQIEEPKYPKENLDIVFKPYDLGKVKSSALEITENGVKGSKAVFDQGIHYEKTEPHEMGYTLYKIPQHQMLPETTAKS